MNEYLKEFLKWFTKDVNHLIADNIVIGGTFALLLHGLNYRDATDLDLIIYNPSIKQKNGLKQLTDTSTVNAYGNEVRSYKIEHRSYILNFVICVDPMPESLLTVHTEAFGHMKVQSIREVLKFKRRYGRDKDFEDIQRIKDQL
jgi:hypothetical protein